MKRFRTIAWAFGIAWRIDKAVLMAVFAVAVALSVLPAVSLGFYKDAIAQVSAFVAYGAGSFGEVLPDLLAYAVLLAFIGLSARIDTDFIATIVDARFSCGMQERLMEVINRFDVLELLRRNVNEDFNYIVRSANSLGKLVSGACSIGAKVVTIATLCVVAWSMSRPVFFITLAYVALSALVSVRFSKGTRFSYPKFRKAEVKALYLQGMPMEANIAKEIRVYGCVEGVIGSWNAAYVQRMNMEIERFKATEVRSFALGASFYLFLAAIMAFLLVQVGSGSMLPADLLTVFTLCTNLFVAYAALLRDLINFDDSLFRLEQMHDLLRGAQWGDAEPLHDVAADSSPVAADSFSSANPSPVVFSAREVSFSYDGKRKALDNVSFDIREGEVVALVGSNGSGKSTLVKLLMGVFSPSEGELCFRNRPYAQCSQDYLNSQIGAFFQDFYLFHHTLSENIAYGAHERIGHEDEVLAALEKGGAAHIAARLPKGTQTLVGKRIDKAGAEFSGGEKQLLATARTYMANKSVLLFDEPASMLDPLAELGQFEAIRNRIGNNTGILISHRVGFARMADRIIMMEGGRIVEVGTHDELMARGGVYAGFFHQQAQWYEEAVDEPHAEDAGERGCAPVENASAGGAVAGSGMTAGARLRAVESGVRS